ncbi:MAG: lipoprotein insertase outer membrane protein LolB [Acidobacteriota bacterium]
MSLSASEGGFIAPLRTALYAALSSPYRALRSVGGLGMKRGEAGHELRRSAQQWLLSAGLVSVGLVVAELMFATTALALLATSGQDSISPLRPLSQVQDVENVEVVEPSERNSIPASPAPPALQWRPWEMPEEAFQALYRVRYDSEKEGRGSFRLTLRYLRSERFQLSATGPLGRSLWSLEVTGPDALLVDHRQRRGCRLTTDVVLDQRLLASFPLSRLPALIDARVPQRPAHAGLDPGSGDRAVAYRDARGRRWVVGLDTESQRVLRWSLSTAEGELLARMNIDGEWRELMEAEGGLELRWQEVVREATDTVPPFLEVPSGYSLGGCVRSVD